MEKTYNSEISEELLAYIENLCKNLSKLWVLESFKESYWRYSDVKQARTITNETASILPITKRPIRGFSGIEVKISEDPSKKEFGRVLSLIIQSNNKPESYQPKELQNSLFKVQDVVKEIEKQVDSDPKLSYRLCDWVGYKTYSPEKLYELQREEDSSFSIYYFFGIAEILAQQLIAHGFSIEKRNEFNE